MRSVVWSVSALADLRRAVTYIAEQNPGAARSVAERIERAATLLGHASIGRPGRIVGTYEKSVSGLPYIIAYAIDQPSKEGERIFILRVVHRARDWPAGGWPAGS